MVDGGMYVRIRHGTDEGCPSDLEEVYPVRQSPNSCENSRFALSGDSILDLGATKCEQFWMLAQAAG